MPEFIRLEPRRSSMRMKPIAILVGQLMASASTAALAQGAAEGYEGGRGGRVTGPDYAGTQTYPNSSSGQQYQQWCRALCPRPRRETTLPTTSFRATTRRTIRAPGKAGPTSTPATTRPIREIRTSPLSKTAPTSIRATTRRAISPARTSSPDQAGSTSAARFARNCARPDSRMSAFSTPCSSFGRRLHPASRS